MNAWISKNLAAYRDSKKGIQSHWIPQHEYIYDDEGRRRVRYVLKFENLVGEFHQLMQRYNLNISLAISSAIKHKSGSVPAATRLGPRDLDEKVRAELEQLFAKDFVLGNYSLFLKVGENSTHDDRD
eukprot:scaffold6918_cov158-Amphora_coffeaeformis.AAC.5